MCRSRHFVESGFCSAGGWQLYLFLEVSSDKDSSVAFCSCVTGVCTQTAVTESYVVFSGPDLWFYILGVLDYIAFQLGPLGVFCELPNVL